MRLVSGSAVPSTHLAPSTKFKNHCYFIDKIDVCLNQFNAKSVLLKKFGNFRAVFDGIIKMLIKALELFSSLG